ncbi:unnamed protein product [Amoebophrya sp. A120]|nr:unnamed protein product [Amoebophrya sp. A120]|eukprot:GSA120T00017491001.1
MCCLGRKVFAVAGNNKAIFKTNHIKQVDAAQTFAEKCKEVRREQGGGDEDTTDRASSTTGTTSGVEEEQVAARKTNALQANAKSQPGETEPGLTGCTAFSSVHGDKGGSEKHVRNKSEKSEGKSGKSSGKRQGKTKGKGETSKGNKGSKQQDDWFSAGSKQYNKNSGKGKSKPKRGGYYEQMNAGAQGAW